MRKISILINCWHINKSQTGIGYYLKNLILGLRSVQGIEKIICALPEELSPENQRLFFDCKKIHFEVIKKNKLINILGKGFSKSHFETYQLKKICEKYKADLIHSPYPTPLSSPRIKIIQTVHDTIPWDYKEYQRGFLSSIYQSKTLKAIQKNSAIITVSNSSKNSLISLLDLHPFSLKQKPQRGFLFLYRFKNDSCRSTDSSPRFSHSDTVCKGKKNSHDLISVIPNIVDENFKKTIKHEKTKKALKSFFPFSFKDGIKVEKTNPEIPEQITKYGPVRKPYLFYFGGFDPRKNVEKLVFIFKNHIQKEGYSLVIGGKKALDNGFYESLNLVENNTDIVKTGFIDEDDLPFFFMHCSAFISLSEAEGFNIPMLMALTAGAKVIVSDINAHREVSKNHAYLVDIKSKNLSENILTALKAKNISHGFKDNHDMAQIAKKTYDVYKSIM